MLYRYDDGSAIDYQADGSSVAYNTAGAPVSMIDPSGKYLQSATYWVDARESAKLDPYTPRASAQDSRPWWERVAEYGLTRAIDNQLGPPAANKTSAPATFAGQNGRTYSQVGGPSMVGGDAGGMLMLLVVGAIALVALSA